MATLTVKMDDALALWLKRESRRLGRTTSSLMRDALKRLKDQQGDGSVLSLVEDTVGSLNSGISDLGSNANHLRGFGAKPSARVRRRT
jgi:hypothetical protein